MNFEEFQAHNQAKFGMSRPILSTVLATLLLAAVLGVAAGYVWVLRFLPWYAPLAIAGSFVVVFAIRWFALAIDRGWEC